ncbi:MAG: class I SAM-dependent methyltransferase [Lachnospiraceae bacterium]|nr:class I SAM-dependent methyltransferase [Lachnospiraceae bacterium]
MGKSIDNLLPKRLKAAADLIPCCDTACDIGCDHGYLSVYLLQHKKARRMIAMDVNRGPLERAKESAALYGMTAQMDFRLSDGLAQIVPGEAEFFICAGMGGKLIIKIMSDYPKTTVSMRGALLQPQSDIRAVRRFAYDSGWHIEREDIIFEEDGGERKTGKYYPMFLVSQGRESIPSDEELAYGAVSKQQSPGVLRAFLLYQLEVREKAKLQLKKSETPRARERQYKLEEEIREINTVLKKLPQRTEPSERQM